MKLFCLIGFLFLTTCNYSGKEESLNEEKSLIEKKMTQKKADLPQQEILKNPLVFDYDTSVWADIGLLDTSIVLDIRYATTNNFVGKKMYDCGRCFLRKEVAQKMLLIHKELQKKGYGLKMFDCYRPRLIQWKLWKKVPDPRYVANPKKGSMHNRGAAVDLTIVDVNGKALEMGTPYDFFGSRAHSVFTDLPDSILQNRQLLSSVMIKYGFSPIRTEWWHFSLNGQNYPLSDMLWKCE